MEIQITDPDRRAVRDLIARSDQYMASLYPPESNHLEPVSALQSPNVLFLAARTGKEIVACGAVKILEDDGSYGEIKRVYVNPAHRGQGISKAIMARLESHLLERRIGVARLETGIRQLEAIGLYRRLGYAQRPPFAHYRPDPLSLFMEKWLRG